MRLLGLCCALLTALSASAVAQYHSHGYFAGGASGIMYHIDNVGNVTSAKISASNSSPLYGVTMNASNTEALAYDWTANSIMRVDPVALTIIGTFYTNTMMTSSLNVYDMDIDQNGELYFGSASASGIGRGIFKIDSTMAMVAVTLGNTTADPAYAPENLEVDILTGELLVGNDVTGDPLYVINRDGSSATMIATGFNFRYGTHRDMNTGDIYSGTCCDTSTPNRSLYWVQTGMNTAGPFVASSMMRGGYDPMIDRASAANPRLVCASWNTGGLGGIYYVDLATKAVVKHAPILANTYDLAFVYGRNLQTIQTGKGTWDVNLNVKGEAGNNFVIALSAAGTAPGVPLPDGRLIPLAPDVLTFATINGLAPFFTGNQGTLDATDSGLAKIDVSSLPAAANGVRIWIGALTLDNTGVKTVVDSTVLKIEGL